MGASLSTSRTCASCHQEFQAKSIFDRQTIDCDKCVHFYQECNNRIVTLEVYRPGTFNPLCKAGETYSKFFIGNMFRYTPDRVMYLAQGEIDSPFWYPLYEGPHTNRDLNLPITLAIPKGMYYIMGNTGNGSKRYQVYIPLAISKVLYPISEVFLRKPLTLENVQQYIEDCGVQILALQNKWWEDYRIQETAYNEVSRQTEIVYQVKLLCGKVYYNGKNIESTVLALDKAIRATIRGLEITGGNFYQDLIQIGSTLDKFRYDLIYLINDRYQWGTNFNSIVNICQVRLNPTKGNLVYKCPAHVKELLQYYPECLTGNYSDIVGMYIIHQVEDVIIQAAITGKRKSMINGVIVNEYNIEIF